MAVNTKIGQAVQKDDFFERPRVIKILFETIQKNCNILIAAPRRVGKTSLMFYVLNNPPAGYHVRYLITQSVNNENEFYKKLYKQIIDLLRGYKRIWKKVEDGSKKVNLKSIGPNGILIDNNQLDYCEELILFIKSLDLGGYKLLVMIDEFAETVENIISDEGERAGIKFLESNRDLRLMPGIAKKVQFIYTGSIGLENIVSRLNKSDLINDLYPFLIPEFNKTESEALINQLIAGSNLVIKPAQINKILKITGWTIPFYLQIIVDELDKLEFKKSPRNVTNKLIEHAIDGALDKRSYFESWHTRLRKAFKGNEYKFIKTVLNTASTQDSIDIGDIFNFAVAFNVEDEYKDLLNTLRHDGYLNNQGNAQQYCFNSPLLKLWWNRNVAN